MMASSKPSGAAKAQDTKAGASILLIPGGLCANPICARADSFVAFGLAHPPGHSPEEWGWCVNPSKAMDVHPPPPLRIQCRSVRAGESWN